MSLRGFKISSGRDRSFRTGVAAQSLQQLKEKAKVKLKLKVAASQLLAFLADGTEVDDEHYFASLSPQTHLILTEGQQLTGRAKESTSPLANFLHAIRWNCDTEFAVENIRALFSDGKQKDSSKRWAKIFELLENKEKRTNLSSKMDDPDWFKDISTNAKTKEEYLTKGCQARIRGYLAKAESQLKEAKSLKNGQKNTLGQIVGHFKSALRERKFYGHYFNRKSGLDDQICDGQGQFLCEGKFDLDACSYAKKTGRKRGRGDDDGDDDDDDDDDILAAASSLHKINPYESAESRVVFSTWNLDHVIERSRSIVPSLIRAVSEADQHQCVNVDYFHRLLFTRQNLKLVHIVCHDKQEHLHKKCDSSMYYVVQNKSKGKGNKKRILERGSVKSKS